MSEIDRSVRRLTALEQSASTARVLNLVAVHRKMDSDPEFAQSPFFKNRLLDRSIILKHRLRPHEYAYFSSPRPTVTKILVPIDTTDLKAGARYAFVGQKGFDQVAESVFGEDLKPGSRDRQVLDLIDGLPSLDPFLLREHLKRNNFEPARAYFGISDADVTRMHEFVRSEVMALVTMSSSDGPDNQGAQAYASRLVEKLLSQSPESGFEPLKQVLKLSDKEYLDGIFSWRGFLYYKWVLSDLVKPIREVAAEIVQIQPRGQPDQAASAYIPDARKRIQAAVSQSFQRVQAMLEIYDKAYASLTEEGKPTAFRDFLLSAPDMFTNLGERLAAVQHIISFWRYRFPSGRPRVISATELSDVFTDFEDTLSFATDDAEDDKAA